MTIFLDVMTIITCIAGLWFGAIWVVESATRIARRLGVSDLVIGLTVVAIGTSAPEFAVTAVAALKGQSDISVGNVVGSNIFNLGFILGGLAIFHNLNTSRQLVYRDGSVLIGTTILLVFFLHDLALTRLEGVVLMTLLLLYIGLLIRQRADAAEPVPGGNYRWWDAPRMLAGMAIIVLAGHFFVEVASDLARLLGISDWVIGVTIVAIGTSAPELATSLVALARGQHGMSAGNLIGSDLFNLLGVLGLAAILHPMSVDVAARSSVTMLAGMVVLVVVMMRTGWRLSRLEGVFLVAITMVRWTLDFTR